MEALEDLLGQAEEEKDEIQTTGMVQHMSTMIQIDQLTAGTGGSFVMLGKYMMC